MTDSPRPNRGHRPMKFRDDIDPATTWVVSDTHFGHDNIVGFCHRPEDHTETMLAEWRAHVPDDATLLHLGDLCYKGNAHFKHIVAKELTGGRKLLIRGNHDRNNLNFYRQCGFQPVRPFKIVYRPGDNIIGASADPAPSTGTAWRTGVYHVSFSHYAWNEAEDGPMGIHDLRLHGHIHNNGYSRDAFVPFLRNHINMSVEQTKYRPVNLKAMLDAVLYGVFDETTEAQFAEARARKAGQR